MSLPAHSAVWRDVNGHDEGSDWVAVIRTRRHDDLPSVACGGTCGAPARGRRPPLAALVLALALVLAACSGEELRDEDGVVINPGEASVFDLRAGDCLDVPPDLSGEVDDIQLVPCDDPHTQEVFSLVTHPDERYPGVDEMLGFADGACLTELESDLGLTLDDGVFISYLLPTFDGWTSNEDRDIVCVLVFPDEGAVTGSVVAGTRTIEPVPPAPPVLDGDTEDEDSGDDADDGPDDEQPQASASARATIAAVTGGR